MTDAAELRDRITAILIDAGFEIEVEATDPALINGGAQWAPDAVVVAVCGDTTSTTVALNALRRRIPDVPLVAVIRAAEDERGRAAISAGANGAVLDRDVETALTATLTAAQSGQIAFAESMFPAPDEPSFSLREKQALGMVVLGFTNQEIAATLSLAESTVKGHLSSAFAKLGVSSRAEAAALILDTANGLGLDVLAVERDQDRSLQSRNA